MSRFQSTNNGLVPFTAEEEADWDAMALAEEERLKALLATEYQRLRSAEYPAMADYLDGIVKGDNAQVQSYINACLAVKAKYPKPE